MPQQTTPTTPLAAGIVATTVLEEACKDVDIAIMVGGFPRKAGMERKDVMSKNVAIYKGQASALAQHASKDIKVVVVANPANTNALILRENAPSIPPENITALTRLDHNRALAQVMYHTVGIGLLVSYCWCRVSSTIKRILMQPGG